MSTRIGCDNLVYAIQTTEETSTSAAVYATPVKAPGVMSVNINPNASQETLFADDGPMDSATTLGKIEVEIQKNELTAANKADLLGHKMDSAGGLMYGNSDVPPYVAIGFRTLKSNGSYRYVWLYKGKFTEPEDQNETKGDGINFQADTVKGQFVKLTHPVTIGDDTIYLWKYDLDEDTPTASTAVVAAWFNAVTMPTESALAALLTVSFAEGTASDSTKATITETAASGNHFAYVIGAETQSRPTVGDAITATTYVSGADIAAVDPGDSIAIYELTETNTAVRFAVHTLLAGEVTA
jgi:phi13 family phage major tail protein